MPETAAARRLRSKRDNALFRRADLIGWIEERPAHDGLTAREIANVSGIYDDIRHGRADRCFDDLKAMQGFGHLRREGRPARWYATRLWDAIASSQEGEQ